MHSSNFKDITGQRFGRLTATEYIGKGTDKRALWRCQCDCGNEVIVPGKSLRNGNTKSCGCLSTELSTKRIVDRNTTHGQSRSQLFRRWSGMLTRCKNKNAINYKDYGGRGIIVCQDWERFESFFIWATANGYKIGLTIDRIDPNGNYCPENCRWVEPSEQAKNRRSTRKITFNGETKCLSDWAREFGVDPSNLHGRSDEEVLAKLAEYARRKL